MDSTTRDQIEIDLNGPIPDAIEKLQELLKEYPDGELDFTTETEYGETYEHLYLRFTRPKTPVELEYDEWRNKLDHYGKLAKSARAYEAEGDAYPRSAELAALKSELGAWADNRMGSLRIFDDEIIMWDFQGGFRRDGTWKVRLGALDYPAIADRNPEGGDAEQAPCEA